MRFGLAGVLAIVLLALLVAGPALVASGAFGQVLGNQPYGIYKYDPPFTAPGFTLIDTTGRAVGLNDFRGRYAMLYFGYTFCPDVCPDTLFTMARARKALEGKEDRLALLFITVDPERDNPDVVGRYVHKFDPGFVGLTGDAESIARIARAYGIAFRKVPYGTSGNYTVDHSAYIFLIDPEGRILYRFDYPQKWDTLAQLLRRLVR